MNIGFVYQDQYPWDIRIEKFVHAFSEEGLKVHIVSKNRDGLAETEDIGPGIVVHRLYGGKPAPVRKALNFPAFFSPFWLMKIVNVVRRQGINLLIVRDLPLSPTAIVAGRIAGIPVVMDMAENYPAMIQDTWTYRGPRPADYVFRNPELLRILELRVVNALDGITVVSEASRSRVQKLLKKAVPIWVVGNTPRVESHDTFLDHPVLFRIRGFGGLVLLYVGGLENSRGLDVVVEAVREAKGTGRNILFVVVGRGESEERLKALAERYGLRENIFLTGYIDQVYVPSVIRSVDVCVVPHYVTEHTNTTVPNKIFDYMAHGKPVLATQAAALRAIVEETGCGFTYRDRDFKGLASLLQDMGDSGLREKLGMAGQEAVRRKYNWRVDKTVLLDMVRFFGRSK